MKVYTLSTTKTDLKRGRITLEEYKLICAYIRTRDKFEYVGDALYDYYKNKFEPRIKSASNPEELQEIKEELRLMPESVGKVFLFRSILFKEDELSIIENYLSKNT